MPGKDPKKGENDPKRDEGPAQDEDTAPDIANVREYSDMILYFVKSGRFQYHALQDYGRRQGVITLLKAHRVFSLTKERRLRPVAIQMTAGEVEQRVYMFALVRNSLSQEELDDIIKRLNNHIDGLTTQEKEDAVISLIHNTRSRMIPGTRNLPFFLYEEDEEPPANTNRDKEGRPIKDEVTDERIAVTEAKREGGPHGPGYRSLPSTSAKIAEAKTDSERSSISSYRSSTSSKDNRKSRSKSSDSTSEDTIPAKKSKGNEGTPEPNPEADHEGQAGDEDQAGDQDEPVFDPSQAGGSTTDTTLTEPPQTVPDHESTRVEDDIDQHDQPTQDKTVLHLRRDDDEGPDLVTRLHSIVSGGAVPATDPDATLTSSSAPEDPVTTKDFQACMSGILRQLQTLNGLCHSIVDFQTGQINAQQLAQAANAATSGNATTTGDASTAQTGATASGSDKTVTPSSSNTRTLKMPKHISTASTSSEEPPNVHESESLLITLFPINEYTPAMDWLLRQDPVQKYLFYEMMRRLYNGNPTSKPFFKTVVADFFDYVISDRLACHLGKSTGTVQGLQFGRFPMPRTLVNIVERNLVSLHRQPIPGEKDCSALFVNKCNGAKRQHLMNSVYLQSATSQQEMAQRLLWERKDFYNHHRHMFPHINENHIPWSYQKEFNGIKSWTLAQGKANDVTYTEINEIPNNIEDLMFPGMTKGTPIRDMGLARTIVRDLRGSGLNKPRFPVNVWHLINSVVAPTQAEIEDFQQKEKAAKARAKAKKKRRRATYAKKHGASQSKSLEEDETDSDSDDSEDNDDDPDKSGPHDDDDDPPDEGGPSGSSGGRRGSPRKRGRSESSDGHGGSPSKKGSPSKRRGKGGAAKSDKAKEQVTRQDLFGSISDVSSSPRSDIIATTTQDGRIVFIQGNEIQTEQVPGPPAATSSPVLVNPAVIHQLPATQEIVQPTGVLNTVTYDINDVMNQAAPSGSGLESFQVEARATSNTNTSSHYQIVMVDPNEAIPRTLQEGSRDVIASTSTTVVRPPREKTPMEKYEDMEDDLPTLTSSSDSNSTSAKFSSDSNGNAASASSTSSSDSKFGASSLLNKMGPPTSLPWKAKTTAERKQEKEAKRKSSDMREQKENTKSKR